jgi:hypothetical protein
LWVLFGFPNRGSLILHLHGRDVLLRFADLGVPLRVRPGFTDCSVLGCACLGFADHDMLLCACLGFMDRGVLLRACLGFPDRGVSFLVHLGMLDEGVAL